MTKEEWIALSDKNIMKTYSRFPLVMSKGEGARLWDTDGKC
jgi:acetylornithine/N-succinyldiaminopimelate aminotransferase